MRKEASDFDIVPIRARLQEYFAHESLNNSRFEKQCGLYNGFVKDLDSQIKFESLAKIGAGCPNLNLGWLFSGVGNMLVGSERVSSSHERWELVSSHTARRTGATMLYLAGVPAKRIMLCTGHSTESNFLRYVRISKEENARMLADNEFFK